MGFFTNGVKFRWGSESLDIDEFPSSLLIHKKKGYWVSKSKKETKKRCESQLVFFFFFLTNDKLQIIPLKFKVVWILHVEILGFEFYIQSLEVFRFYTPNS